MKEGGCAKPACLQDKNLPTIRLKDPTVKYYNFRGWREARLGRFSDDYSDAIIEGLEHGVDIGITTDSEPSIHLTGRNPTIDPKTCVCISKTVFKWHARRQLLGPFLKSQGQAMGLRLNAIHGVPKLNGDIRPVINNSDPKSRYHESTNGHIIETLRPSNMSACAQ